MVLLRDVARVRSDKPASDGDVQNSAWLLWKSVTEEAKRKNCSLTSDGFYVYTGAFRSHVRRLWPELSKDERVALEKQVYGYLNASGIARCVQKKDPPVWHVAVTWNPSTVQVVRHPYKMSRTEQRLTPSEAGEDREPGEVTITVKETTEVTINDHVQRQREERQARRELIAEFMKQQTQPLVAEEIAFAFGNDVSTIRKDLADLEQNNVLVSRKESANERQLRYGGDQKPFARRSTLWFAGTRVPPRLVREAVSGYVIERSERARAMRGSEIDGRLFDFIQRTGSRARFTALQVASKTGLNREVTRSRMNKLLEAGVIEQVGFIGGARQFKIADKNKASLVLDRLNGHEPEPEPEPEPTFSELPLPPAPSESLNLAARAKEVLDENERLRERCTRLQRELDERSRLVDQLQRDLDLARSASIDAETVQRLSAWTPAQ